MVKEEQWKWNEITLFASFALDILLSPFLLIQVLHFNKVKAMAFLCHAENWGPNISCVFVLVSSELINCFLSFANFYFFAMISNNDSLTIEIKNQNGKILTEKLNLKLLMWQVRGKKQGREALHDFWQFLTNFWPGLWARNLQP